VISNDLWFEDYVKAFTNASSIINEDYVDAEDLGGLFSGFDPDKRTYDMTSWQYADASADGEDASPQYGDEDGDGDADGSTDGEASGHSHGSGGPPLEHGTPTRDESLQDPRCVFQILKRHYARYTAEMVEEVCGISQADFEYLARSMTEN